MLSTYEQRSRTKLAATVIAVLVVAGIVLIADHLKSHSASDVAMMPISTTSSPDAASNASVTPNTPATAAVSSYKDGGYSATENYIVPPGGEQMKVSLTLQSGVVTGVSVQNSEIDSDSASYQEGFSALYKKHVIGQKISSLRLNTIAGASETTQAFNQAVDHIASQAQA
jgi:uncharacterized protein with FMN-binding domain